MKERRVWDRGNQMPPGTEFVAYHFVDTVRGCAETRIPVF